MKLFTNLLIFHKLKKFVFISVYVSMSFIQVNCQNVSQDSIKGLEYYKKAYNQFYYHQDLDSAILNIDKAITIFTKKSLCTNVVKCYHIQGHISLLKGDNDKAIDILKMAIGLCNDCPWVPEEYKSRTYNLMGLAIRNNGDFISAIDCFLIAKKIASNSPTLMAAIYHNLGIVYDNIGEYNKSKEHFLKSLSLDSIYGKNNETEIASSYNSIGGVYYRMHDYENAIRYFEKSIQLYNNHYREESIYSASCYFNLGEVFSKMNRTEDALFNYHKAIGIWISKYGKDHYQVALTYLYLSNLYFNVNDIKNANNQLSFASECLKCENVNIEEMKHKDLCLQVLINKGMILEKKWMNERKN